MSGSLVLTYRPEKKRGAVTPANNEVNVNE